MECIPFFSNGKTKICTPYTKSINFPIQISIKLSGLFHITIGSYSAQVPIARFQRPVCPGVWGLTEENAQAVLDRIVFNALQADIPVAEEPDCGANVWVIVVDDAEATFERLREEDSFLTRHLTRYQERKIGKCVSVDDIAGVQTGSGDRLVLFLRDRRMVSARLEKACRARDFYSGFYLERSKDGKLCIERDKLQSRAGANCEVDRLRELVPVDD